MHALRIGNVAFDGVGVGVHNHDVGAVGDVNAARVAIDVDIIPALIAGNGNRFDDVIAGGAGLGSGVRKYRGAKKGGGCECSKAEHGETFAHIFLLSLEFVRTALGYTGGKINGR